ncbi:MAG: 16S rRNA (cytosine(967)-C(5))-methyltransferase RsmB [Candidatus Zixiibacteriota bacterium]|nr:MAG: 16S rRNA (cytosine(967)-C(5))-methyltransferase RsmB [candidate division Zixibacteria bacterium]
MARGKTQSARQKFDPVRAAALQAIIRIEQGDQTEAAIKAATNQRAFRPLDHRFIQQLVNGTTKMRRRLDHEIKFYLARPSARLSAKLSNILRLGFYQLLFTDRVPPAAAVSESVNLARHFLDETQCRLVNAVLRARLREPQKVVFPDARENPTGYLASFYSYPDYFAQYCVEEFGFDDTVKLMTEYNKPPRVTYRANFFKAKPDEVANVLQNNNIEFSFGRYLPEFIHIQVGGLPLEAELLKAGKVFIQDESAGLPVRLLNPKPGAEVLDLTAAPGGKSTYAAIRMRNKGRVTSVDKSRKRLKLVVENARRLGIKIISPVVGDVVDFEGGPYDRVLLDPPCSGWGTAGKLADLRWSKTPEDINNLVKIQAMMIDRAAKLVKPGGLLVYSTCTVIRSENDQIVEEFLLRNNSFQIDSAEQFFERPLVTERGFVKTYPVFEHLDGSFCARLKRKLE